MIIYLYRWKVKAGQERNFVDSWKLVTTELKEKGGSLGSRLHAGSDGMYYGYAQWPNEGTRENALRNNPQIGEALQNMRVASEENFQEIALDPLADFLEFTKGSVAPIIYTPRLILRPHSTRDFEDCLAMWSQPEVTEYIGGKPSTPQQTWSRILNYIGHWGALGFGYWAVEERATRQYIGEVGFADFKRNISQSVACLPEIGWALAPEFHGNGYASEAIEAALAWGDNYFGQSKTMCIIHPENVKSIKIAERNGYELTEKAIYNDHPTLVFIRSGG